MRRYTAPSRRAARSDPLARMRFIWCRLRDALIGSSPEICLIGFAEAIAAVGHRERSVRLCRHLDPIGGSVVDGRRRRPWARLRGGERRDRHGREGVVKQIGDEETRHGVLLPTEVRKKHLPDVLETWGGMQRRYVFRFSPFVPAR